MTESGSRAPRVSARDSNRLDRDDYYWNQRKSISVRTASNTTLAYGQLLTECSDNTHTRIRSYACGGRPCRKGTHTAATTASGTRSFVPSNTGCHKRAQLPCTLEMTDVVNRPAHALRVRFPQATIVLRTTHARIYTQTVLGSVCAMDVSSSACKF